MELISICKKINYRNHKGNVIYYPKIKLVSYEINIKLNHIQNLSNISGAILEKKINLLLIKLEEYKYNYYKFKKRGLIWFHLKIFIM